MKKLQIVIIFDRELGLRRSKNESCSKWRNEAHGQFEIKILSKILSFTICFLFF